MSFSTCLVCEERFFSFASRSLLASSLFRFPVGRKYIEIALQRGSVDVPLFKKRKSWLQKPACFHGPLQQVPSAADSPSTPHNCSKLGRFLPALHVACWLSEGVCASRQKVWISPHQPDCETKKLFLNLLQPLLPGWHMCE